MKNIIFKVFYILIIIYLIIFIPVLWGKRPLVIISGSMEPILKVGGILYYEKTNLDDFKKDDILVYQLNEHIVSHRIVNINEYGFETKGDNNNSNDSYIVDKNNVIGRGNNWSIPYIGYYADFIYNHKYLLIVMIILFYFNIWFNPVITIKFRIIDNPIFLFFININNVIVNIIKNIAPPKLVINLAIGVVKSEIKKVDIIL